MPSRISLATPRTELTIYIGVISDASPDQSTIVVCSGEGIIRGFEHRRREFLQTPSQEWDKCLAQSLL